MKICPRCGNRFNAFGRRMTYVPTEPMECDSCKQTIQPSEWPAIS